MFPIWDACHTLAEGGCEGGESETEVLLTAGDGRIGRAELIIVSVQWTCSSLIA